MKILTIDIETAPHVSVHWGRWQQNIPPEFTLFESSIVCWAAKWHGEKKMIYSDIWVDGKVPMLTHVWQLLDEADLVVSFNGRKFDMKKINGEFLELGMTPPSPYHQVDLFVQTKKHFSYSSNKLKHLLKRLGLAPKIEEDVNMQLWIDACWHRKKTAQKLMQKYCKQDVRSTEEFYDYMLGWIQPHLNWGMFVDDDGTDDPVCPNCGSKDLIKKGQQYTKVRTYQRWKCKDCGSHHRGRRHLGKPGVENGVLA